MFSSAGPGVRPRVHCFTTADRVDSSLRAREMGALAAGEDIGGRGAGDALSLAGADSVETPQDEPDDRPGATPSGRLQRFRDRGVAPGVSVRIYFFFFFSSAGTTPGTTAFRFERLSKSCR